LTWKGVIRVHGDEVFSGIASDNGIFCDALVLRELKTAWKA